MPRCLGQLEYAWLERNTRLCRRWSGSTNPNTNGERHSHPAWMCWSDGRRSRNAHLVPGRLGLGSGRCGREFSCRTPLPATVRNGGAAGTLAPYTGGGASIPGFSHCERTIGRSPDPSSTKRPCASWTIKSLSTLSNCARVMRPAPCCALSREYSFLYSSKAFVYRQSVNPFAINLPFPKNSRHLHGDGFAGGAPSISTT